VCVAAATSAARTGSAAARRAAAAGAQQVPVGGAVEGAKARRHPCRVCSWGGEARPSRAIPAGPGRARPAAQAAERVREHVRRRCPRAGSDHLKRGVYAHVCSPCEVPARCTAAARRQGGVRAPCQTAGGRYRAVADRSSTRARLRVERRRPPLRLWNAVIPARQLEAVRHIAIVHRGPRHVGPQPLGAGGTSHCSVAPNHPAAHPLGLRRRIVSGLDHGVRPVAPHAAREARRKIPLAGVPRQGVPGSRYLLLLGIIIVIIGR
jgi:hypothetical protein